MHVKINTASTTEDVIAAPLWYTFIFKYSNEENHGRRPVDTLPDHGINIGTDVPSLAHKEQEQHRGEREFSNCLATLHLLFSYTSKCFLCYI